MLVNCFKSVKKSILHLICSHLSVLFEQFNLLICFDGTAQNAQNKLKNSSSKLHFSCGFLLIIFAFVYGIVGLEYEARGGVVHWRTLLHSPYLFLHQMYHSDMLHQGTFIMSITSIASLFLAGILARQPPIQDRFKLYWNGRVLRVDSQVLTKTETTQIVAFCRRSQFTICIIYLVIYGLIMIYCLTNVWFNANYCISVWSAVFWLALFPLLMFYIVHCT